MAIVELACLRNNILGGYVSLTFLTLNFIKSGPARTTGFGSA